MRFIDGLKNLAVTGELFWLILCLMYSASLAEFLFKESPLSVQYRQFFQPLSEGAFFMSPIVYLLIVPLSGLYSGVP